MYNKVELCGVDTAQLPVLSETEKRQLLTRARAGDAAARQAMIEGNLRLVLSVVQRFAQRGENLDDLFQVGCIGLIKAIDNFDPAQPVRFSTYGVPMIIGEIRRFLRDNNALRVSRSLRDTAYRAMQSREELEKQLGREPTVDEIAQKTGLPRREVSAALESVVRYMSLELGNKNIRVHAVSPGPILTRAASGIASFDELMANAVLKAPLQRLVTLDEIAQLSVFLCSDAASGMTGQTIYVDGGCHAVA